MDVKIENSTQAGEASPSLQPCPSVILEPKAIGSRASLPLPPLRGAPRNAPDSIVFPDLVGDLLLFVEEDSPAERHADHRPPVMLMKISIGLFFFGKRRSL